MGQYVGGRGYGSVGYIVPVFARSALENS
jgi:hypothetical protein